MLIWSYTFRASQKARFHTTRHICNYIMMKIIIIISNYLLNILITDPSKTSDTIFGSYTKFWHLYIHDLSVYVACPWNMRVCSWLLTFRYCIFLYKWKQNWQPTLLIFWTENSELAVSYLVSKSTYSNIGCQFWTIVLSRSKVAMGSTRL